MATHNHGYVNDGYPHGYENDNLPPKGYQELEQTYFKGPRMYQRLITTLSIAVGRSYDEYSDYEYPEPRIDSMELYSATGKVYHPYSPVSP